MRKAAFFAYLPILATLAALAPAGCSQQPPSESPWHRRHQVSAGEDEAYLCDILARITDFLPPQATTQDKALAVLEWIPTHFRSGRPELAAQFATLLLREGKGICGERAKVFSELMHTQGVRARYVCIENIPGGMAGHTTVELYYDDAWHWFDPTLGFYVTEDGKPDGPVLPASALAQDPELFRRNGLGPRFGIESGWQQLKPMDGPNHPPGTTIADLFMRVPEGLPAVTPDEYFGSGWPVRYSHQPEEATLFPLIVGAPAAGKPVVTGSVEPGQETRARGELWETPEAGWTGSNSHLLGVDNFGANRHLLLGMTGCQPGRLYEMVLHKAAQCSTVDGLFRYTVRPVYGATLLTDNEGATRRGRQETVLIRLRAARPLVLLELGHKMNAPGKVLQVSQITFRLVEESEKQ